LPSPEALELAQLLVHKAEGDESVLDRLLDDVDVPDDVLGFHAQQAIEKRLKAVLAFHEVEYDRTHSIGYLTSLLQHHGINLPAGREQIEELIGAVAEERGITRFVADVLPENRGMLDVFRDGFDAHVALRQGIDTVEFSTSSWRLARERFGSGA
jgi:HEPN domain-containing protein